MNLRMARKRSARKADEAEAEKNRKVSSIPGRKRRQSEAERELEARRLDGARIEKPRG